MIFGPKRDRVRVEWGRLNSENVYDEYCSPNIIQVIKQRRMGLTDQLARMDERRCMQGFGGDN